MGSTMLTEAQIKRTIEQYLDLQQNMGVLAWFRLNAGSWLVMPPGGGRKPYKINGCPKGTADILVIKRNEQAHVFPWTVFIEIKKETGKQSKDQVKFEKFIKDIGADYVVARSLEDVQHVLALD